MTEVAVPTALSDLFFNHDLGEAEVMENGQFARWDDDKLREEAASVLSMLETLGLSGLPSAEALVADFHARV